LHYVQCQRSRLTGLSVRTAKKSRTPLAAAQGLRLSVCCDDAPYTWTNSSSNAPQMGHEAGAGLTRYGHRWAEVELGLGEVLPLLCCVQCHLVQCGVNRLARTAYPNIRWPRACRHAWRHGAVPFLVLVGLAVDGRLEVRRRGPDPPRASGGRERGSFRPRPWSGTAGRCSETRPPRPSSQTRGTSGSPGFPGKCILQVLLCGRHNDASLRLTDDAAPPLLRHGPLLRISSPGKRAVNRRGRKMTRLSQFTDDCEIDPRRTSPVARRGSSRELLRRWNSRGEGRAHSRMSCVKPAGSRD